ncbi:MAG: ferredoxin family protein [Candidatus Bipolaricaulota bacterium]|nr:ferredoxin family protein [Candidatus Bipolaricaulota bacterium]MBS3791556.1 ferredoxin family protein [Candidatus Bipolaricaulota bacterium]
MSRGKVEIDDDRCKGCGLCIEACPQDVLEFSDDFNSSGYNYVTPENPEDCIGCGFCGKVCPDVAITVYKLQKEGV